MICIIDYGAINLGSLKNSLDELNIKFEIKKKPTNLKKFSHVILPGVGNFGIASLKLQKWRTHIYEFVSDKKYLLGICLGMQLLFETSQENNKKKSRGLGLIEGHVSKLPQKKGFQIPHMGWNNIDLLKSHNLFRGIDMNIDFYFAHSFYCKPENDNYTFGQTNYIKQIPTIVIKKNI